jgi:membrane protein
VKRLITRLLVWIDTSESTAGRWTRAARAALLGEMSTMAAGTALFAILATVPALAAAVAIYSLVADPGQIHQHLRGLERVLPPDVVSFVGDQLERHASRSQNELGIAAATSLIVALYSARGAASSLIDALNRAYRVRDTRHPITKILVAIAMAGAAIVGLMVMLTVIVGSPAFVAMIAPDHRMFVNWVRWPTLMALVFFAFSAMYRWAPSPRPLGRHHRVFTGAITATLLLIAVSFGLSEWVERVANYELFYGAFGSVIVLVLWFYLSVIAAVIGGFVNAELEREAGAPAPSRSMY